MSKQATKLRKPTLLIILDGFGLNPDPENNAVVEADTPNFDRYFSQYPMTRLQASGRGVGLPEGQMGNSEVGHMTIGSGMIVKQDLVRIDDAIEDGSFYQNPALLQAIERAKAAKRPLHLAGLVSDGGVHSHITHLEALIRLCHQHLVVAQLHMITDGRDTAPQAAVTYVDRLEALLDACGGRIGTVCGRYYAMDRDQRWQRVAKAWEAMVRGKGNQMNSSAEAIQQSYKEAVTDEFIKPTVLPGLQPVQSGDEIVFFNFRNDRTRQIAAAFAIASFDDFDRGEDYKPVNITCMTHYDSKLNAPVVFAPDRPQVTLASVVSSAGLRQLHCAETEKYPHVTFFFNGGREACFPGEDRRLIDSPRVSTYDMQPEMSAAQVADTMIDALRSRQYDFLVVNFANGDMVGHTAVREAILQAVKVLDYEVGRVLETAESLGYSVILTADHGNCDEMVDPKTGEPQTQHSQHPVPCLVIDDETSMLSRSDNLSAIAPTVLQLMGLAKPQDMTGSALICDEWAKSGKGQGLFE
ncbi:MAG: 2,3-bisphosphoglycerate-independent phosphoglycerate mutase [Gammaproteobacteria bacterium]|nr:2,3-bisphosphoglycerate-independent phosphoglycerate mutase [Gammaproteobacteria bacterium]